MQHFEIQLKQKKISDLIINKYQSVISQKIEIISFEPKYAKDFKDLNIAWLKKYFVVEPHDSELLDACEETIINRGGFIFFCKNR